MPSQNLITKINHFADSPSTTASRPSQTSGSLDLRIQCVSLRVSSSIHTSSDTAVAKVEVEVEVALNVGGKVAGEEEVASRVAEVETH